MGVLEDFFVKAKTAVGNIGEKAGQFVDVSKLNIRMAELKSDLRNEYENLGKSVYKSKKEQIEDPAAVNYMIAQIDNLCIQIDELRKQIAAMKNKVLCKFCDQPNETGSSYCAKCGKKIEVEESKSVEKIDDDFVEFDN